MEHKDDKTLVVSSNNLVEAKYDFTLWQKRIFVYMVSQINVFDQDFKLQKFFIKDLMKFFGVKSKDDYATIRRVPEELYQASMKTPYKTPEGFKRWKEIRIISQFTRPEDREEENSYIELKFNDDLKPHLVQLKELFAQYDIRNIIGLRSVYSFRMYEILKSRNHPRGEKEITVEELKEILDVERKYKLYGDFKRKVLLQAQNDLNECCDITFTFVEKKHGKKVASLVFNILANVPRRNQRLMEKMAEEAEKNAAAVPVLIKNGTLARALFPQIQPFGISRKVFDRWAETYPEAHLEDCVADFLQKLKTGKIREQDPAKQGGYLRILIEKADFSQKTSTAAASKKPPAKPADTKPTTAEIEAQRLREVMERDKQTARELFTAHENLLSEITIELNEERGAEFFPDDFEVNALLRALVIGKVRGRFPERF